MNWNNQNPAHASLWFFEKWHHDDKNARFPESGNWQTTFLIKSGPGDSSAIRKDKANAHASLLDEVFTKLYRADYEPDSDSDKAVADMSKALKSDGKTIKDLAPIVDNHYQFAGELS